MSRRFPDPVDAFIPHRGRMKVLDRVVHVEDGLARTETVVTDRWPLCDGREVSAVTLVEVAAQSAAAYVSWERQEQEDPGGRGFLVGLREASWSSPSIPVGTLLRTTLKRCLMFENYATFSADISSSDGFKAYLEIQAFRV